MAVPAGVDETRTLVSADWLADVYMWFDHNAVDIDTVLTTKYGALYPVSFTYQPTKPTL